MELRTMRINDVDSIYEIECKLFPNPWPRSFFENDLHRHNTIALVLEDGGRIIGYALATCAAVELHVTNVAVRIEHQRRGLASMMMHEMEDIAAKRGCAYAYLEVRETNEQALRLYEKLGYRVLYERKKYYIDGTDAFVMGKQLSKEVL